MYALEKVKLQSLHHKTHIAELWHGAQIPWQSMQLSELAEIFLTAKQLAAAQELHAQTAPLNFAMPVDGLIWPAAALLAWQKGMALHLAICVGRPEDPCTQFIRTGCLPAGQPNATAQAAAVILRCIDAPEQAETVCSGGALQLTAAQLARLNQLVGIDAVTDARAENYVCKIYEMTEYVLHPETGRLYTGLQDYRVMWAESTPSIILALQEPAQAAEQVCELLHLPDVAALRAAQSGGRKRFEEY